jgi:hypothetical protein
MSGGADPEAAILDTWIEGLGKIEDAQKIKAAFPYLPDAAVSCCVDYRPKASRTLMHG